jgi:hypothetical protein
MRQSAIGPGLNSKLQAVIRKSMPGNRLDQESCVGGKTHPFTAVPRPKRPYQANFLLQRSPRQDGESDKDGC